jgi:hypothetical protein
MIDGIGYTMIDCERRSCHNMADCEICYFISVTCNQGKVAWQISRALLCPLALALSGDLSR